MDNKKYNLAFVVDAFQPFHNGHKTLINEALKHVVYGASNSPYLFYKIVTEHRA